MTRRRWNGFMQPAIPDFAPASRRRLVDRLAPRLPLALGPHLQLSLQLRQYELQAGVDRVSPRLILVWRRRGRLVFMPILPLPGSKVVELWDAETDEWMTS